MITPEEARKISNHSTEEEYWLNDANKMIQWAAKKGRNEVYIMTLHFVAKRLRKMGYKVTGFGSGCYHVRW